MILEIIYLVLTVTYKNALELLYVNYQEYKCLIMVQLRAKIYFKKKMEILGDFGNRVTYKIDLFKL